MKWVWMSALLVIMADRGGGGGGGGGGLQIETSMMSHVDILGLKASLQSEVNS